MRTTLELDDELRARLVELAAERGEKGYSSLVNEALREYLAREEQRQNMLDDVLSLRGSLDEAQAEQLRERVESAWGNWDL